MLIVPFTFRIRVSHWTQEPPFEFLPAEPGITERLVAHEGLMATTTDPVAGVQMIALSEIRHDQNVRQAVAEEVDALAQSIALLGQLVPVSVRPDSKNGGYVLIAGHKRYVALAQLGHTEIRAEVRPDGESEAAERCHVPGPFPQEGLQETMGR